MYRKCLSLSFLSKEVCYVTPLKQFLTFDFLTVLLPIHQTFSSSPHRPPHVSLHISFTQYVLSVYFITAFLSIGQELQRFHLFSPIILTFRTFTTNFDADR